MAIWCLRQASLLRESQQYFLCLHFQGAGCNLGRWHTDIRFPTKRILDLRISSPAPEKKPSGATHTRCISFSPHPFCSSSLSPSSPTNALTPTQIKAWVHAHKHTHTQLLTNHLRQICWSLCTQIKLMTSCVRSQWTKWSCSSLPLPCNIQHQNQTRDQWFIRVSVRCVGLGLVHAPTQSATQHTQSTQPEGGNSTSVCGAWI